MDYIGQTELRKKQQKVRNKNYILETNGTFMTTMTPGQFASHFNGRLIWK